MLPQCLNDPYYGAQTQVGGNSGNLNTTPDQPYANPPTVPIGGGALRFTNDANAQSGAIVSNFAFALAANGLQVTFTTETYEGDYGGGNHDGADGMSFFLVDDSYVESANPVTGASYGANNGGPYGVTLGDWGGSLGYTCSNTNNSANQGYAGMIGGYMGLGIDEFGNFLNGDGLNASGVLTYGGDNTSSGYGYVPNRVGLRGAGATAWAYLSRSPTTSAYYPLGLSAPESGRGPSSVPDRLCRGITARSTRRPPRPPRSPTASANPYNANPQPTIALTNTRPSRTRSRSCRRRSRTSRPYIAAMRRRRPPVRLYGVPITYNLSITTQGLFSLSYSFGGRQFSAHHFGPEYSQQRPTPPMVRFGFGGSTGGSRNIHEIMCFQASPQGASASAAGLNQKEYRQSADGYAGLLRVLQSQQLDRLDHLAVPRLGQRHDLANRSPRELGRRPACSPAWVRRPRPAPRPA